MTDDLTDAQWHQKEQEERQRIEASLAYFRLMFESETCSPEGEQMDISSFTQGTSKYLKAGDLQGKEVKVVISGVETGEFDNATKPVLKFQGKEKGLVCNVTNARRIAARYGGETDEWIGKPVYLYTEDVEFQGNMVPAIRVRVPQEVVEDESAIPF